MNYPYVLHISLSLDRIQFGWSNVPGGELAKGQRLRVRQAQWSWEKGSFPTTKQATYLFPKNEVVGQGLVVAQLSKYSISVSSVPRNEAAERIRKRRAASESHSQASERASKQASHQPSDRSTRTDQAPPTKEAIGTEFFQASTPPL